MFTTTKIPSVNSFHITSFHTAWGWNTEEPKFLQSHFEETLYDLGKDIFLKKCSKLIVEHIISLGNK